MKRFLSLILAIATVASLATFVSFASGNSAYLTSEPVKLPNLSKESVTDDGFRVWSEDVSFDSASKGITFVFRASGVDEPITANKINPTLVLEDGSEWKWSTTKDKWQWNHVWGGIFAPEMVIPKDGVYYLYLNQKVLVNNGQIAIKGAKALDFFCKSGSNLKDNPTNNNDNAKIEMLAVVQNDLKADVQFYDGSTLLTTQSVEYTSVGNATAGDNVTGIEDGVNNKKAKRFEALLTPDELFRQQTDVELPTKPADDKIYRRVWRDEDGNIVDGIYKSGKLTVDFVAADTSKVDVTFLNTDGSLIYTRTVEKSVPLSYTGKSPVKEADDDYTYTFAGWSLDGENVVDLATYQVPGDVLELTFKPVFKKDLILKANIDGDSEITMGQTKTYKLKLNRADISTDVVSGKADPITSGKVIVSYPAAALKAKGQSVKGELASVTLLFSSVSEDLSVSEIEFTAASDFAGKVTLYVTGDANGKSFAATERSLTVTGQQQGLYIDEPQTVEIPKTEDGKTPDKLVLWSGNVPFESADAVSFVYKTEGIDTPVNAYQLSMGVNGSDTSYGYYDVWNKEDTWGGAPAPRYHTISGNGYYVLYINKRLADDEAFTSISSLGIFATSTIYTANNSKDTPKNENENAKLTVLAVVGEALAPTVTFHDAQGGVIADPYTYKYIDESKFHLTGTKPDKGDELKQTVKLLTPAEIFAEAAKVNAAFSTPEKAADGKYTYTFKGWADADGNEIEAVYKNSDLYPVYEKTAIDPVEVSFVNGDTTVSTETFPGAGNAAFSGATPVKVDGGAYSYQFRGWTTDKSKTLATSAEQAASYVIDLGAKTVRELAPTGGTLTLYAVFEQTNRMWSISFRGEDNAVLTELRVLDGKLISTTDGSDTSAPAAPEKAADGQYTYTPAGWADKDGKQVIDKDGKLTADVTADITVYPVYTKTVNKYTVTFRDENGSTVISEVEVEYGKAAAKPADPTKADDTYYSYKFAGWADADGKAADLDAIKADLTVYASFKESYKNPFADVKNGKFYSDAVQFAVTNNVMNGTDATHFSPDSTATRAQMVTVLYRLEGSPSVVGISNPFNDLGKSSAYYYNAVLWAYDRGLVTGVSATEFKPNNTITREQFVTILYRYAKEIKGYYMGYGKASINNYPDKNKVHDYAAQAFNWAIATADDLKDVSVEASLRYNKAAYITGVARSDGKSYLAPGDYATRAQMVTMLYRFLTSDHVDAPPSKMTGLMTADPSVYVVGDEYLICVLVEKETTMWVEVNGKNYYDHSNGILRSDKFLHTVRVPQEALDSACGYTVHLREIIERKPYYTVCGGLEEATYDFRPVTEKDHYNIINLADSHSLVDAPIASGSYFGNDLDLLVMNGDIIDNSGNIASFKILYRISGGITKGEVPCVYSRGNHELRGIYASQLSEYTPTDHGNSYYTFRVGPIWGIVMDAGEDKPDDNAEYGNTVACEAFREEESEFLDKVIASREWEGAKIKLIISHVPFVIKMSAPYNIEEERYADWSRKLASIEPTLWMTGHFHQCFFELPGERAKTFGYPCPFLCSSYSDTTKREHTSGAVTITDDKITARYVTEKGVVTGERTVDRWR